jgi:hypothetical protein
MININNIINIEFFQEIMNELPKHNIHNYAQMLGMFDDRFHYLFDHLKFLGGTPEGAEPLVIGNPTYTNTSFLTLHEIIALLPNHKHLGLTQNEIMNIARLIQFYETTRFNDCLNTNTAYEPYDLLTMTFTSSPAYCVMYDADNNVLCSIDFLEQKFKYFDQPFRGSNNFFFQFYKSLNSFFSYFRYPLGSPLRRSS